MSYEVELKFQVAELADLRRQLDELGLADIHEIHQSDEYFRHPVRDFAQTDEAFRIRSQGERVCLTYKGPKLDAKSKTRREIEVAIDRKSPPGAVREMLLLLGFQPAGCVNKNRVEGAITHQDRRVVVAMDQVDRLGEFVEFEIVIEHEQEIPDARETILALAEQLNVGASDRRGYIQMIEALEQASS